MKNSVIPSSGLAWLRAAVRASSRMLWAFCALVFHTFCPLTTKPPRVLGPGPDARGIRPGSGLGDAERHQDLAPGELGQKLLLQVLASRGG